MPNKKGQWTYQEAVKTKKTIYDLRKTEAMETSQTLFTYSELKEIFGVVLTTEERENMIYAFKITKGTRGCVPLYYWNFEVGRLLTEDI